MVEYHRQNDAEITIGALRVPLADATQFGVMRVDAENRIVNFREKPQDPDPIPGDANHALASMGIYVFNRQFLMEKLLTDANLKESRHDFGNDIIPSAIERHRVFAFPFRDENRKRDAYWRDVGTLDAYYQASMDLISVDPMLNLYDRVWPVRTHQPNLPPPKFVFGSNDSSMDGERTRRGLALDSIVCQGSIISGGRVHRSIIGSGVRVNSYAEVDDSILFEDVEIGRGAVVRRAILDKGASIAPGATVGVHEELDRRRNLTISNNGIVVVSRGERIAD
jgi:glucose-1-phosphate adenylyltransferase